jgi:hypothetical protein
MEIHFACIVEGHGDREAAPIVIRRLAAKLDPAAAIHIPPPIRIPKNKLLKSWFLAAAESLRGHRGLATDLDAPPDPEAIRAAKEWLTAHMAGGRSYVEALDQPALAARFDLDLARRADSFDKCYREISRLLMNLNKA